MTSNTCSIYAEEMKNYGLESALSHYQQQDGVLFIGSRSITSLVEEHRTPLYIYDSSIIEWRHGLIRDKLPKEIEIYYAIKANPNTEIIRTMGIFYDGFDVASKGEIEQAVRAGISPKVMSFAGPGKTIDELTSAIKLGIGSINVESEREFEHIRSICMTLRTTARILIRVNPSFDLNQSGMKMGGGSKQFGVDSERVPALIERITHEKLTAFEGIHIFLGSQNLVADQILTAFERIMEYASDLSALINLPIPILNMGGGFGIPYFARDKDLDLGLVGENLNLLLKKYQARLPKTRLRIELGRFLVGECGLYLCKVLYRKTSRNQVFLVLDGGMHHHLAASGNLGQSLVKRPMPLITANGLNRLYEKVIVAGPLCTPLDTFGVVEIPYAKEGDLIAILNSGAYGLTASPVGFLSHSLPKELVI